MLLTCRLLKGVADVNNFGYAEVLEVTEGDSPTFFIQLADASVDSDARPSGRRYMPATGATLQVRLYSLDSSATIQKAASQPYQNDPSIWSFQLAQAETIPGTRALVLQLTEGSKVTNGYVSQAVVVNPLAPEF